VRAKKTSWLLSIKIDFRMNSKRLYRGSSTFPILVSSLPTSGKSKNYFPEFF
jgi:hypothetical protein